MLRWRGSSHGFLFMGLGEPSSLIVFCFRSGVIGVLALAFYIYRSSFSPIRIVFFNILFFYFVLVAVFLATASAFPVKS